MKLVLIFILSISFLFASVDMNNANEKDFSSLIGIGSKKAADIVSYRVKNGCFKSVDSLSKVKGVGKKTVEKNRADLVLGDCKK